MQVPITAAMSRPVLFAPARTGRISRSRKPASSMIAANESAPSTSQMVNSIDDIPPREKRASIVSFPVLETNPLEVPRSLVDAQVRELQLDAARRMGAKDVSQLPPPEPFVEPARRRVALGLLIGELIKTRGITLDRQRVEAKLAELAGSHPEPEALLKVYRENPEAMRQVENVVLEEQVVEDLLSRANVVEQPSTFREIMNFGA